MVYSAALHGFKVSIWSNRRSLPEYEDSALDNSGVVTSRYVQCNANTEFEIVVEFDKHVTMKTGMMDCLIYVDGQYTDSLARHGHELSRGLLSYLSSGVQISDTKVRRYRFASLRYEEGTRTTRPAQVKDIGCITIKVFHSHYVGSGGVRRYDNVQGLDVTQAVSEKAFKGQSVSNVVRYVLLEAIYHILISYSFGETKQVQARTCVATQRIGGPAAIINLYYRSEGKMCAGIVSDLC